MAHFTPEHFSGTVRTTKDDLRYGPLKWRRVNTLPPNTYGRNGDFVIVDDTAESDENIAISRTPVDVALCQKIPLVIAAGDFTITAASGVYTITIATLDDFVEQVNRANIPELRVEYTDPKSPEGGNNFLLHANSVTFADGTSDLPSVLGLAAEAGDVVVATGAWECFPVGTTAVDVLFGGVPVVGTPFTDLNFTGAGVTSVVDAGSGRVDITISGGGGGVAYGAIVGDVGTATATAASETITFGGSGITITATNAGAGLDTVDFDLDISDLAAGGGTPIGTDTIAINDGGTTVSYPLSSLSALFGGVAYGMITADVGTSTATTATENITYSGTGIIITATDAGAGLDTISWVLDISDLPAGGGTPIGTDTIAINDGGTTVEYPLSSLAGLFGGTGYGSIAGGDGGTATATTASELITFNGTGINITSTNAGAGSDTTDFVLDISDLPAGAGPLSPTDELAVNDGGTTERHSIEDVVEAVLPGIAVTTINGQPMLTLEDTTRGNKILSVAEQPLVWSSNKLDDGDWIEIANANDTLSGYIMDFDGTVVFATGHCENTVGNTKDIRLFINAADNGVLLTLTGGADADDADETLNIDFSQGDKIRLRADDGSGGAIEDTVVKLTVKWRG